MVLVALAVATATTATSGCGDGAASTEREWCAQHWHSVLISATPENVRFGDLWGESAYRMYSLRDPDYPLPEDPAAVVEVFREGNAPTWDAACSLMYESWGSLSEATLAWCLDEDLPLSPSGYYLPRREVRDALDDDDPMAHFEQPEAFAEACRAAYESRGG